MGDTTLFRALLVVLALLCRAPGGSAAPGGALPVPGDTLTVAAELEIRGNRQFSVERLRGRLGAGRSQTRTEWRTRLDSLGQSYGDLAFPSLRVHTVESAPGRITAVELEEGPRLVLGQVRLLPDSLAGQLDLTGLTPGRVLGAGVLEQALADLLDQLDEQGRALAVIELREVGFFPREGELQLDLELALGRLERVHPMGIRFRGLTNSLPGTLERLSRLEPGAPWSPRANRQARLRLQRSGWFSRVEGPLLARDEQGHLLLVEVEELPSYRFEGLVGLLPAREGAAARVSFLLALDLENLLGTGRRLNLKAARPDGISQELRFRYREPFVFGLPLGLGGLLEQFVQDSTWLSRSLALEADWELGPGILAHGGLVAREILPDSLNGRIGLGMDRSSAWSGRGGLELDFRDDALNPTRGWTARLEVEAVQRKALTFRGLPALGPDLEYQRQKTAVGLFARPSAVLPNLVLALGLEAGRASGDPLPLEERSALGGSFGLRGYRDGQFRVDSWGLAQGELRWLLGRSSRAWLFWDLARLEQGTAPAFTRQGRGLGVLLPIPQGVLSLEYALGENLALRQGILHLKLSSRF